MYNAGLSSCQELSQAITVVIKSVQWYQWQAMIYNVFEYIYFLEITREYLVTLDYLKEEHEKKID